jgi:hypothetical protein
MNPGLIPAIKVKLNLFFKMVDNEIIRRLNDEQVRVSVWKINIKWGIIKNWW